jgi:hypothetical protein
MSVELRVLLIFSSVIMIAAVVLRIRKSKFQIYDGIFWFLLSLVFLVLSIFPQIAVRISLILGIESPANLIFLCILAILLLKCFLLSLKVSLLEYNLMKLTGRVAVEQAEVAVQEYNSQNGGVANERDDK